MRSNAIAPGFIETEMTAVLDRKNGAILARCHPHEARWYPDNVADCAVFLASDLSAYITGQVIQVDGGMSPEYIRNNHQNSPDVDLRTIIFVSEYHQFPGSHEPGLNCCLKVPRGSLAIGVSALRAVLCPLALLSGKLPWSRQIELALMVVRFPDGNAAHLAALWAAGWGR
ncbi:MAG: SDR family oxidoreductase [Cyclobacteriaceae bacterium]|nr:SDR family oxidoreductase [Cyclobacteriaceae bacterium]